MKILIVAYYFPPDNSGGVKRPSAFYKYLRQLGNEVFVLTHGERTERDGDIFRIRDFHQKTLFDKASYLGSRVVARSLAAFGIYTPYYSYWLMNAKRHVKRICQEVKPDIVIGSYPPIECLYILREFQKMGCKTITDFRDPLILESAEQESFNKFPYLEKKYRELEYEVCKNSAAILCISPPLVEYYNDLFKNHPNVLLLPNGYDLNEIKKINLPEERIEWLNKIKSPGKVTFLYTGTVSFYDKGRSFEEFFDAIKLLLAEQPDLKDKMEVLFFGDFRKNEFKEVLDELGPEMIRIFGKIPMAEATYLQQQADVLLLITDTIRRSVATGKIFEYMLTDKITLGLTKNTFAEEIIHKSGIGITASPRSVPEIQEALRLLVNNKNVYIRKPNQEYIRGFDRSTQVSELNNLMHELI